MNGRVHDDPTPAGRLAAVATSLSIKMAKTADFHPDYADFKEAFAPYVKRELLLARIDEARLSHSVMMTERVKALAIELAECEQTIPKEYRL